MFLLSTPSFYRDVKINEFYNDRMATEPLLGRLPAELSNNMYRQYFDSFQAEKTQPRGHDIRMVAKGALNLLVTDRSTRGEASLMIYEVYKEYQYLDFPLIDMIRRIKAVASLASNTRVIARA
jgi:hypothetical protein